MVKDLELIRDITPLFARKSVIWGIGKNGRKLLEEMLDMDAGKRGIYLCDIDSRRWGEDIGGMKILSPDVLSEKIAEAELKDINILIPVLSIQVQDEIIKNIKNLWGGVYTNIYTWYAIDRGIYLNIKNPLVNSRYRRKKLLEHLESKKRLNEQSVNKIHVLNYFAFLPLHNDEVIIIHSMGKTGSSSIYRSIQDYGRNVLHCHVLSSLGEHADDVYNLLNAKSAKIISFVRDPVARQISAMWQNFWNMERYSDEADFTEIENYYFEKGNIEKIFNWFEWEVKNVLKIDVLAHPFDQEKGYSIIKQENIEFLIMRTDRLNDLEQIVEEFLDINQFQLRQANIGKEKPYRFAMQAYKDSFAISRKELEDIYKKNEYVRHFYSEQEREQLYQKWMKCAENDML